MNTKPENNKEQILEDNYVMCILTEKPRKATSQENNLQSIIRMLNEEYGFDLTDMERDFIIIYTDPDTWENKEIDLAIFEKGKSHDQDFIIRIAIVQDEKIKENDKKKCNHHLRKFTCSCC